MVSSLLRRNWWGVSLLIFIVFTSAALLASPISNPMENIYYKQLLGTIAKGESKGNYNAYWGKVDNNKVTFTSMTIGEVLHWQSNYLKKGHASNAVGRYQFLQPTLEGLVKENKIDKNVRFDENLQDELAIQLLKRRGLKDYMEGKITKDEFAYNLSQEWAALPKTKGKDPHKSYYAGDGLNKVQVSVDEIYSGIESLHKNTEAEN